MLHVSGDDSYKLALIICQPRTAIGFSAILITLIDDG